MAVMYYFFSIKHIIIHIDYKKITICCAFHTLPIGQNKDPFFFACFAILLNLILMDAKVRESEARVGLNNHFFILTLWSPNEGELNNEQP